MAANKPVFNPKFSHEQIVEAALDYCTGECQMDGIVIMATWRDKDGKTRTMALQGGNVLAVENMIFEIEYEYRQKWEAKKKKIEKKYEVADYEEPTNDGLQPE